MASTPESIINTQNVMQPQSSPSTLRIIIMLALHIATPLQIIMNALLK